MTELLSRFSCRSSTARSTPTSRTCRSASSCPCWRGCRASTCGSSVPSTCSTWRGTTRATSWCPSWTASRRWGPHLNACWDGFWCSEGSAGARSPTPRNLVDAEVSEFQLKSETINSVGNVRRSQLLSNLSRFWTWFWCVSSQVFGLFLWIVCWTDLFYSFHEMQQSQTPPPIFFITPLVLGATMVGELLFDLLIDLSSVEVRFPMILLVSIHSGDSPANFCF